jgi:hypothetical protein
LLEVQQKTAIHRVIYLQLARFFPIKVTGGMSLSLKIVMSESRSVNEIMSSKNPAPQAADFGEIERA